MEVQAVLYEKCFACEGLRNESCPSCPFCAGQGFFPVTPQPLDPEKRARDARVWCLLSEPGQPPAPSANEALAELWQQGRNYHAGSLGRRTEAALLCDWDMKSVVAAAFLAGAGVPVYGFLPAGQDFPTARSLKELGVTFFADVGEFGRWLKGE